MSEAETRKRNGSEDVFETQESTNFRENWPGWATVESEPAIFSSLLKAVGVQDLSVEEIYSLDEDSLNALQPLHGLIFLFRWKDETNMEGVKREEIACPEDIWFANQVIENACASLALLNIVLNIDDLELGDHLASFKSFTKDFSPALRGLTLTNFEYLRKLHNSFARKSEMMESDYSLIQSMISHRKRRKPFDQDEEEDEEDCFHFIAYIYKQGHLWELDGLKRTPVKLESCTRETWTKFAGPQIQARMARYNSQSTHEEIRFNLLGVCEDPIIALRARKRELEETLIGLDHHEESDVGTRARSELETIESRLRDRAEQEKQYSTYAQRRRHDYVPFTIKMLDILNRKGLLKDFLVK